MNQLYCAVVCMPGTPVASTGITDLSGQLRGALDQFAGVSLVPFSVVAGLVFLYILLIGPGDYLLWDATVPHIAETVGDEPATVLLISHRAHGPESNA